MGGGEPWLEVCDGISEFGQGVTCWALGSLPLQMCGLRGNGSYTGRVSRARGLPLLHLWEPFGERRTQGLGPGAKWKWEISWRQRVGELAALALRALVCLYRLGGILIGNRLGCEVHFGYRRLIPEACGSVK